MTRRGLPPRPPVLVEDKEALDAFIDGLIHASAYATRTVEQAKHAQDQFASWCKHLDAEVVPLPAQPATIASYLAWMAVGDIDANGEVTRPPYAYATIRAARQGIGFTHRRAGLPDPTEAAFVDRVLRGIRRCSWIRHPRQQDPLTYPLLRDLLSVPRPIPAVTSLRDQAAVLLGSSTRIPLLGLAALSPRDVRVTADHGVVLLHEGRTIKLACRCDTTYGSLLCPGAAVASLLGELSDDASLLLGTVHPTRSRAARLIEVDDAHRASRAISAAVRGTGISWAPGQALPAMADGALAAAVAQLDPATFRRVRDDAVLLCGWHLALRGGEVGQLDISEFRRDGWGWTGMLERSKGDQLGAGAPLSLLPTTDPVCDPVRALDEWLVHRGHAPGALFPTGSGRPRPGRRGIGPAAVSAIVRERAAEARLRGRFTSHSLRIGFVVSALRARASVADIMTVTRHRDASMVGYYSRGELHRRSHAAARVINRIPRRDDA